MVRSRGPAHAKTLIDRGRFSEGEAVLANVLAEPAGPSKTRDELRDTLVQLYFWEGRRDAASQLLEAGFRNTAQPADVLRSHWLAENAATLVGTGSRRGRSRRASTRPTTTASGWHKPVSPRRPVTFPAGRRPPSTVRRTPSRRFRRLARRLDLRAWRDEPEGVHRALAHLPAALFSPAERLEWKAWLASRAGDAAAESNALRRLLDVDPANANALDRLATLATEAGDRDQARDTGVARPKSTTPKTTIGA